MDPNWLNMFSDDATVTFGRYWSVAAWLIIGILFLSCFVTLKTQLYPAYFTILFG